MPQTSQSGRVVRLCTVSQGYPFVSDSGSDTWTGVTNNTGNMPPLIFTGVVFSSSNQQKLWYADGSNGAYYDPLDNSINTWVASAGTLPVDIANNTPRLIETWRGRTVLSGLLLDPQNIFLSRQGDPTDFDYAPVPFDAGAAVAFNAAHLGQVGRPIMSICPYSDDVLLIWTDSEVWALEGDPTSGGKLSLITDRIGGTWGRCWCRDDLGTVYFVSNRLGIYAMTPGQQPQRISQPIEQIVEVEDTGNTVIRCEWHDRFQGVEFFFTNALIPSATQHLFWERRTGAWWIDSFANANHNPVCCCVVDGNREEDRVVALGSWDGYVRAFQLGAADDDGTPIQSNVFIGPILTKDMDSVTLHRLQAILGSTSGDVNYAVYAGATAEQALVASPQRPGVWSANRSLTAPIRVAAHALYVYVSSLVQWQMEQIKGDVSANGMVRRRGK